MRIACVLITHLRAKVELRRHPHLKDRPAVIVDRSGRRPLVVDHFPAASGVTAGMTLEQALSRHAGTIVLEADEPSYRRLFHQVLASLQGTSDRVEGSELGTAYVGLDGLEGLYGGEARLVNTLKDSVPQDLKPRVGAGDAKFPALVAARTSKIPGVARVPSDVAAFLAPHPIDLLPISSDMKAGMHRFGLHTMGDAAFMREEDITGQFGLPGKRAWALCHGIDDSPLVPLKHQESIVEHTSLPFSSTSTELLLVTVDTLLRRVYSRPEMRGRYAGRAALECLLSRPPLWEKEVHFKQEVGNWERASAIIRSRLEEDHPQASIEEVTLVLSDLTGGSGVQTGLFHDLRKDRQSRLAEAERQLQARTKGNHALHRVVVVAPWHPAPEMRAFQVPLDPSGRDAIKPLSVPTPVEVREGPGRRPVMVRMGKRWHRVARVEDLWSFDLWWMPEPLTRTYYRVTGEDGRQATLFRDQRGGCWYRQGP